MKNNIIIQLFLALCVCCACSSDNDQHIDPIPGGDDLVQIKPTTKFFTPNNSETRGGGVIDADAAISASFFRIDEAFPANWSTATFASAHISAAVAASTGAVTLTPTQYYNGGNKVRLIGVYPAIATGQWTPATGTVTQTIDGYTDIMATSLVECWRTNQPSPTNGMTFEHLLTQIEVSVIATSDEVASPSWGTIKSVTLKDRAATCNIVLPAPTAAIKSKPTVNFSGALTDLVLRKKNGDIISTPMAPSTSDQIFGYCMFPPVASTLPLLVETSSGGTVPVTVPVPTIGGTYEAGHYYKVQLKLEKGAIVATATIKGWILVTPPIVVTL